MNDAVVAGRGSRDTAGVGSDQQLAQRDSGAMALWRTLGRGPGYVLLGFFIAAGLFVLAWYEKDTAGLTGPLGALGLGTYGGGAVKEWAKRTNNK